MSSHLIFLNLCPKYMKFLQSQFTTSISLFALRKLPFQAANIFSPSNSLYYVIDCQKGSPVFDHRFPCIWASHLHIPYTACQVVAKNPQPQQYIFRGSEAFGWKVSACDGTYCASATSRMLFGAEKQCRLYPFNV